MRRTGLHVKHVLIGMVAFLALYVAGESQAFGLAWPKPEQVPAAQRPAPAGGPRTADRGHARPPRDLDPNSGQVFPAKEILELGSMGKLGALKVSTADKVQEILGEKAAVVKEFGVRWLYQRQVGEMSVVVLRFQRPTQAYGAYCALRPPKSDTLSMTSESWLAETAGSGWVDEDVVMISRPSEAKGTAEDIKQLGTLILEKLSTWHSGLPNRDPEEQKVPFVVRHLPMQHLDIGTLHYAVGRLGVEWSAPSHGFAEFPLTEGVELAWAEYNSRSPFVRLAIAEYPTPQDAGAAQTAVEAYLSSLPAAERSSRLVKRRGNFILQAYGVTDVARAGAAMEGVRYDYVVRWLGNEPYRGLDTVSEARKTATMLISIFQMIMVGSFLMAIFGVAAGSGYFYWRRRSAQNTTFSDAGGMMRLNLTDTFVLPATTDSSAKRLESGEE